MKRLLIGAALVAAAAIVSGGRAQAQDRTLFMDVAAENLFRYSRAAIAGSGKAVNDLRSLVLTGTSRFVVDDAGSLTGAAVEIKLLLPDRYLRIDTSGIVEKVAGYAGKTVLSAMRDGPNVTYPPNKLVKQILLNERLRVARLLLGTSTYVGADLVLTFRSVPKSMNLVDPRVNPRTAIAVENSTAEPLAALVAGDHFSARMLVDGVTRAPARLEYPESDGRVAIMSFDDRRSVDGMMLPFHILTMSGGRVIDELTLNEIRVNPELSKNDFVR